MATRVINDAKLQNIAVAIQAKDNGGQMTVDEMPGRIEAIPTGSPTVLSPALVLWDWEGTKLAEYSAEDALALTELPAPSTLPAYADVDHELLLFRSWNWSLANIKTWIQNHEGRCLDVGAIYTTTDGHDHNYWGNPRFSAVDDANAIIMQKHGTEFISDFAFRYYYLLTQINIPENVTSIEGAFENCYSLTHINIPDSVTSIAMAFKNCYALTQINIPENVTSIGGAFESCYSLTQVNIPENVTNIGNYAFQGCGALCDILLESKPTLSNTNAFSSLFLIYKIYVPRADLSWFETATNWASIYTQGHIVAIEDYIEYLESIGFNVDAYKGA